MEEIYEQLNYNLIELDLVLIKNVYNFFLYEYVDFLVLLIKLMIKYLLVLIEIGVVRVFNFLYFLNKSQKLF